MAHVFRYKSYKHTFSNIPSVVDHMKALQQELADSDLVNLQYFNITYLIITQNVYSRIGTGYFRDELAMKNLDIIFAKYYFDALKEYAEGKQTTPAWQVMFDFCKKDTSMPLIYLALGVNAHVNNDLGLSLFDVIKTDFKSDFDKVNPVIYNSLDEVLRDTKIHTFYKPFMKLLIFNWRHKAWKNYDGLKHHSITKYAIETKAFKIAKEFAKINSMKDYIHLKNIL